MAVPIFTEALIFGFAEAAEAFAPARAAQPESAIARVMISAQPRWEAFLTIRSTVATRQAVEERAILRAMASAAPERPARRRRRSRSGAADGREPIPRAAWTRLAACTAAAALLQLDGTVITVALPSAARDLHVSASSTSLVLSAYFVAFAVMLFPGGRLVDRLGVRHVALLGLGIFAVGAGLGAVAPSLTLLCATRVIQGIGAGLVSPAALAGAISGFPPDRRGSALGIWGASAGMANRSAPCSAAC